MEANIGLFGGTFDPVHYGHIHIAEAFLESELVDELWILLTPDPPHKKEEVQTPYAYREKMLESAFEDRESIKISTIENTLPRPTYTIQTLEHLAKNYPSNTFYLCIGEDSLANFAAWYRYEDIIDQCELVVARRPGVESDSIDQQIMAKTHFVDHEPVDISSSDIRQLLKENKSVTEYLPESVIECIEEYSLYSNA